MDDNVNVDGVCLLPDGSNRGGTTGFVCGRLRGHSGNHRYTLFRYVVESADGSHYVSRYRLRQGAFS